MRSVRIKIVYTETVIALQCRLGPIFPDGDDLGCLSVILHALVVPFLPLKGALRRVRLALPGHAVADILDYVSGVPVRRDRKVDGKARGQTLTAARTAASGLFSGWREVRNASQTLPTPKIRALSVSSARDARDGPV